MDWSSDVHRIYSFSEGILSWADILPFCLQEGVDETGIWHVVAEGIQAARIPNRREEGKCNSSVWSYLGNREDDFLVTVCEHQLVWDGLECYKFPFPWWETDYNQYLQITFF